MKHKAILNETNSNNYSIGNHFFKVLVQIHYSLVKHGDEETWPDGHLSPKHLALRSKACACG